MKLTATMSGNAHLVRQCDRKDRQEHFMYVGIPLPVWSKEDQRLAEPSLLKDASAKLRSARCGLILLTPALVVPRAPRNNED